jgi:hypothetical protein
VAKLQQRPKEINYFFLVGIDAELVYLSQAFSLTA